MTTQLDLFTQTSSPIYGIDYNLIKVLHGRSPWSWEGLGRFEGTYSERNFATRAQTEADVKSKLGDLQK